MALIFQNGERNLTFIIRKNRHVGKKSMVQVVYTEISGQYNSNTVKALLSPLSIKPPSLKLNIQLTLI